MDRKVLKILLKAGADLNAMLEEDGMTCIMNAITISLYMNMAWLTPCGPLYVLPGESHEHAYNCTIRIGQLMLEHLNKS